MQKKYTTVIFDVDGTMLNTAEGILSAAVFAIKNMGYQVPDKKTLETFIGPPIQDSFAKTYGISGNELDKMAATFRKQYKDKDLLKACPYEGIFDVFAWLKSHNMVSTIATYKRQDYAETIIKYFGFDKYTNIICGADFAGKLKKNDIIENSLKIAKANDIRQAVMIGDTNHDAQGAEQLGIDFIGVTYGFGFKKPEDVKGKRIVGVAKNTGEIIKILSGGQQNED